MQVIVRRRLLMLYGGGLMLCAPFALAQQFPSRPVTMIVGSPPGGPTDVSGRVMQPVLQRLLGQTVIVENVPGASGSIGLRRMLNAPADGHTLFLGTPSDAVLAPMATAAKRKQTESMRLVSRLAVSNYIVALRPGIRVKGADEWVAQLRDWNKDKTSYASFGIGSVNHLMMEDFKSRLGLELLHVPYQGMAPTINALIGDQIDVALLPIAGPTVDLVRKGRVQALAVLGPRRNDQIPDVPTVDEGRALAGIHMASWLGVFVPIAVPLDVVEKLNATMTEVVASPEFKKLSMEAGTDIQPPMSVAQSEQFFATEIERYGRVAKAIKLEAK